MSAFECECDFDGYWEFSRTTCPTARKRFVCQECDGPIGVGETYERHVGKWEGVVMTNITCCRCLEVRQWVRNSIPCFCWNYGELLETVVRVAGDAEAFIGDEVAGLKLEAKRRVAKVHVFKEAVRPTRHRFFEKWVWGQMIGAGLVCA